MRHRGRLALAATLLAGSTALAACEGGAEPAPSEGRLPTTRADLDTAESVAETSPTAPAPAVVDGDRRHDDDPRSDPFLPPHAVIPEPGGDAAGPGRPVAPVDEDEAAEPGTPALPTPPKPRRPVPVLPPFDFDGPIRPDPGNPERPEPMEPVADPNPEAAPGIPDHGGEGDPEGHIPSPDAPERPWWSPFGEYDPSGSLRGGDGRPPAAPTPAR
ncbi:hypothetical protein CSPHI_02640 [Corynebacterium sphenisci DSM 44792]|uniref:Uncharacterized protein n=1 Tax=Corynebacterium sphenisci DSM 44792 TaxID=1437874 RepID=A0A1L7CWC7_9CORY|nr:hypothetical protein [Corynebacterium sphenisci]APT90153.1 hypothetical protein CSPHI_02640 [Corynebacterium sphenisci DSM 44792]